MSALRIILPTKFTNTEGLEKYTRQIPPLPIESLRYYSAYDAAANYAPTQEVLAVANRGTGIGGLAGLTGSSPTLLEDGDRPFLRFDGVNDTLATNVSDSLSIPAGASLTMWALARYPAAPAQNFSPIFMYNTGGIVMSMTTSRTVQAYRAGLVPTSLSRSVAIDDNWHVFMAIFNTEGLSALRVDNVEVTLATTGPTASSAALVQVGLSTVTGKFVEIDIMALGTHAKALSPEERVVLVDTLRASYLS